MATLLRYYAGLFRANNSKMYQSEWKISIQIWSKGAHTCIDRTVWCWYFSTVEIFAFWWHPLKLIMVVCDPVKRVLSRYYHMYEDSDEIKLDTFEEQVRFSLNRIQEQDIRDPRTVVALRRAYIYSAHR